MTPESSTISGGKSVPLSRRRGSRSGFASGFTLRASFPRATPTWPRSLNNLGVLLQAQGDYGEARGYLERALAMNEALYPKERYPQGHPDLAGSLNNLGCLLQDQGDYGEARGYLRAGPGDATRPSTPGSSYPQATPTWPAA